MSTKTERALFLIDVENLYAEPRWADAEEALHAITMALHVGGWHQGDHVRIAANRG